MTEREFGPGGATGTAAHSGPQEVVAQGDDVVVLRFDPEQPILPILDARRITVVGGGELPAWLRPARVIPFADLLGAVGVPDLRRERPRRALVCTLRGLTVRGVLAAIRHGVEWFHLMDSTSSQFPCNARGALVIAAKRQAQRAFGRAPRISRTVERRFGIRLNPRFPSLAATNAFAWRARDVDRARGPVRSPGGGRLRIVHCIGALGPGGAERQLTYLASASRTAGHDVTVVVTYPCAGDDAHNVPALRRAGVPLVTLAPQPRWRPAPDLRDLSDRPLPGSVLDQLDEHEAYSILVPLLAELARLSPHVVHCWLDEPNVLGGLAALLVGVPRIVVSTRNVNPTHFPRFHKAWYESGYRALLDSGRVLFVANSAAGARDYATWLGVPPDQFTVIYNGLPLVALARDEGERARVRAGAGLSVGDFLVAAVFRLAPEKRPLDLVQAVAIARRAVPRLRVWHFGVGPVEGAFRRAIQDAGLDDVFTLHGRREDPWALARAADVTVLCSGEEGCPNVSIESQANEVPVLLTDAGGSSETTVPGEAGIVVPVGDLDALARGLVEFALDPARARAMGTAGRRFVHERFGLRAMVTASHALYGG